MQMIESSITERELLPLPAAALVIDIRGVSDDNVIEWLKAEMADLALEMKVNNIFHWRFLMDFLSFRAISPDMEDFQQASSSDEDFEEGDEEDEGLVGPMGQVHTVKGAASFSSINGQTSSLAGVAPFNTFEQKVDELCQEIDRLRTNRTRAVADLNKAGIPGHSTKDATVRVIFLTDANRPASLKSAALYAQTLKDHSRKLKKSGHQEFINTTVLCLGNTGMSGPPRALIEGLTRNKSWSHLDTLIVSENYREDGAFIAGTTQAYLAEMLLYVLLIIPPFAIGSQPQDMSANNGTEVLKEQESSLPLHTYVVGLAALEHSARWGKRWLNFGLAKEVIEILQEKPVDSNKEKKRHEGSAEDWFQNWRSRVQDIIKKAPIEVQALQAIHRARDVKAPVFPGFSFTIAHDTLEGLRTYQTSLAQTYDRSVGEPALQDAILQSTPQVLHILRQSKQKSVTERQNTELGNLQVETEQILSSPQFFQGATGSMPRARTQLQAIANIVSRFQRQEHQGNPLNPLATKNEVQERRDKLNATANTTISNLDKHIKHLPFLSYSPAAQSVMQIITLVLIMAVSVITMLCGFAWLHHLISTSSEGLLNVVDTTFLRLTTLEWTSACILLIMLLIELAILRPILINKERSSLNTELVFGLSILAFALTGLFVNFSLESLTSPSIDIGSLQFLAWLSFIPQWAIIAVFLFALLVIVEIVYFFSWLDSLYRQRRRIIKDLREQHEKNIQDVTDYIADDIALEILHHAELTDGSGGPGSYYTRMSHLCDLLEDVKTKTQKQQQLAAERLLWSQRETQREMDLSSHDGTWLDLTIRDEKLEMDVLTDEYKEMQQQLSSEREELRDLAEFVLRSIGVEKFSEISQLLIDKDSRMADEQRELHLFITALAAIITRFAVEPLSVRTIAPITDQYKNMQEYAYQHMPTLQALIQALSKRMSHTTLKAGIPNTRLDSSFVDSSLVTDAMAIWMQRFWQDNDHALEEALMQDGVLSQLARILKHDYDPRAIMRRLLAHTALFGRSLKNNRGGELFLLLSPSLQSYLFRQGLKSMKLPRIIDFPDTERILLLGVQHYVAEPLLLTAPPSKITSKLKEKSAVEEDETIKQRLA